MKIAVGADHRGFECKKLIVQNVKAIDWLDVGCFSGEKCDYPEFAKLVVQNVLKKKMGNEQVSHGGSSDIGGQVGLEQGADLGILLCGSGVGMVIAANRFKKIYAGLCWSLEVAKMAKEDDNINVLVIPTDFVTPEQCLIIINSWLKAEFKDGHYQARLDQIDRLV